MSFYIEKIIVTGSGKTDSIIELSNGVNIIYGPSNTGKTYIVKCIDYMFGSEREPIDSKRTIASTLSAKSRFRGFS